MIKTFEEACEKLGQHETKLPDVSALPEKYAKSIIAHFKLMVIIEAINNGWIPDWDDSNQAKYYPWFKMGSGFGFSYADYVVWESDAYAGSRLAYETVEKALYGGKQFEDLYNDFLSL